MKKFCSKCGSQLDLSKKACSVCHAFNPYFIAGYSPVNSNESFTKDEMPAELVSSTEPEIEEEQLYTEPSEREKVDFTIKNELLRVKEETEQYKKETLDLVKDVQKELEDIDKENRLLKEKMQSLKMSRQAEVVEASPSELPLIIEKKNSSSKLMPIAAVVLTIIIAGFSYFVLSSRDSGKTTVTATSIPKPNLVSPAPIKKAEAPTVVADTTHPQKLLAMATSPVVVEKPKPVANTPAPSYNKPATSVFSLSAARVMGDLVGKKLSGCDITINSTSEIDHVDNLVLVEKLSASYLKYKCTVKIKQGTESYTASPYIYYSAEGTFIKIDGTNCE